MAGVPDPFPPPHYKRIKAIWLRENINYVDYNYNTVTMIVTLIIMVTSQQCIILFMTYIKQIVVQCLFEVSMFPCVFIQLR